MQTQQYLTDTFSDLSQKSPELINEFKVNAESQRLLIKSGENLLSNIIIYREFINGCKLINLFLMNRIS